MPQTQKGGHYLAGHALRFFGIALHKDLKDDEFDFDGEMSEEGKKGVLPPDGPQGENDRVQNHASRFEQRLLEVIYASERGIKQPAVFRPRGRQPREQKVTMQKLPADEPRESPCDALHQIVPF